MDLQPGSNLNSFEITGTLGVGGMGQVYRARDTRLGREVAIKVLPPLFTEDPDRLARFEREARLLANLSHPNIGALYEVQEFDGAPFLVMQLIEGETLSERIASGPMRAEEAVPLFIQIAEALEAAHAKNIVHRDLKPANVKITPEGRAIVLDFGLAVTAESVSTIAGSPTESTKLSSTPGPGRITTEGIILGTPSHMAPEQARGKRADKRADVWAFGCCLFEALTGRSPFQSDTVTDTLAAVLHNEVNLDDLPRDVPWRVRDLISQCLVKDPNERLRDIGDAIVQLKRLDDDNRPTESTGESASQTRSRWALYAAIPLALLIGAGTVWFSAPKPESLPSAPFEDMQFASSSNVQKRFTIDIGATRHWGHGSGFQPEPAISPDGNTIAFTANVDGVSRLYIRDVRSTEIVVVPDSIDARLPFFSPDGRRVAYFGTLEGDHKLVKVSLPDLKSLPACSVNPIVMGGAWMPNGTIVFSARDDAMPALDYLYRVSENGGPPERILEVDTANGARGHANPSAIPGTNSLLFAIDYTNVKLDLAILDLETDTHETILEDAAGGQYVSSGHIVFSRDNSLWTVPYDEQARKVTGDAVELRPGQDAEVIWRYGWFAIGGDGALLYRPEAAASPKKRDLVWVNRNGGEQTVEVPLAPYTTPRVSPDSTKLIVGREDGPIEEGLWLHEFGDTGPLKLLTFNREPDRHPVWMPDSKSYFYCSIREGLRQIYHGQTEGVGDPERLMPEDYRGIWPSFVDPYGEILLYSELARNNIKIGHFVLADQSDEILLELEAQCISPSLSPDRGWLVYSSNEEGIKQVFVRPYPNVNDGRKYVVSRDGGEQPLWSPHGDEIYYRNGDKMMAVAVDTSRGFRAEDPVVLFEREYYLGSTGTRQYDLEFGQQYDLDGPEANRFLLMRELDSDPISSFVYVDNWAQELTKTVPTAP